MLVGLREPRPRTRTIGVFAATPSDRSVPSGSRECLELNAWLLDTRAGVVPASPPPATRSPSAIWAWRLWIGLLVVLVLVALLVVIPAVVSPSTLATG